MYDFNVYILLKGCSHGRFAQNEHLPMPPRKEPEMSLLNPLKPRKLLNLSLLAAFSLAGSLLSSQLLADGASKEFIVKMRSLKTFNKAIGILSHSASDRFEVKGQHQAGSLISLKSKSFNKSKGDIRKQIISELEAKFGKGSVEYVVPNKKLFAFGITSDPKVDAQWALSKVALEQAWETNQGSKDVVVAVIDTGVDTNHPDLKQNIWINQDEIADNGIDDDNNGFVDDIVGWDFWGDDDSPMDDVGLRNPGHGTHCAGVIGAVPNNNIGISGAAPSVSMMAIRFLGADGSGDFLDAIRSIDYAIENGAHIISASWGAPSTEAESRPLIEAIARANDAGVLFVAAAANEGRNNDSRGIYPANVKLSNVISVAASNSRDGKPSWSNYGKRNVSIAAPGDAILSTLPNAAYGKLSGTSMAVPMVSGILALMASEALEQGTKLTGPQAYSILQASGDLVDIETQCQCRINAGKALAAVGTNKVTVVPSAKTLIVGEEVKLDGFGGEAPYSYSIDDLELAEITEEQVLVAKAPGAVTVEISDSLGEVSYSKSLRIIPDSSTNPGQCPLGPQLFCNISCFFNPNQDFCEQR